MGARQSRLRVRVDDPRVTRHAVLDVAEFCTGDKGTGIYGTCTSTGSWEEHYRGDFAGGSGRKGEQKNNRVSLGVVELTRQESHMRTCYAGTDKGQQVGRYMSSVSA